MRLIGNVDGKGLYAEWNDTHNQIRYNLDGQEIAVYDMDVMNIMETPIVFKNNTIANELSSEAKDKIQILARNVNIEELKEDESKYNKDKKRDIAETLQIDEEEITSITEVDLDEKVESDEKEDLLQIDDEKELATTKDIAIKQEIKMSAMATSMKSIGQVLQRAGKMPQVEGKTFTKIGIIESDRVKDIDKDAKTNTTRFSLVAISTDGTVVPLNLEQDHQEGNNPREISHRVNADGSIEQDDVNSRFIIGNSGETISIKFSNGPGDIEVGYSAHKTLGGEGVEGNVSIDHQLQTDSVYWKPRTESREKEYGEGIYGAEERAQEAYIESKHEEEWERGKKGITNSNSDANKDIDGDQQTKDSAHEYDFTERARELMQEDENVENVFTEEEVIDMLKSAHDEGTSMEEAEENIKEDASRMPGRSI